MKVINPLRPKAKLVSTGKKGLSKIKKFKHFGNGLIKTTLKVLMKSHKRERTGDDKKVGAVNFESDNF